MKKLNAIFISITFWQLSFSPLAVAKTDSPPAEEINVIKQYNSKNTKGSDLIAIIRDHDKNVSLALEAYLKKNGIKDYDSIAAGKIEVLKDNQIKMTIEKKDYFVNLLDDSSIKISYKNKSTIISTKEINIEEWINGINSLNPTSVSFHFSNLFINDAYAIAPFVALVAIAIAILIGALSSSYILNFKLLDKSAEYGKKLCKEANDPLLEIKEDTVKIQGALNTLRKVYDEKCKSRAGRTQCVEASKVIDCLNNVLHPGALVDSQRGYKPSDATGESTNIDNGYTTQK